MIANPLFFTGFMALIVLMLVVDQGLFHRKDHVIGLKEAGIWTAVWIAMALLFSLLILFKAEWIHGIGSMDELLRYIKGTPLEHRISQGMDYGAALDIYRHEMFTQYLAGYLLEKSLSIDNIFVMILIFASFGIEKKYYHRVLFWGVTGAIVLRFIFIFALGELVTRFSWILAIFGFILIYSGIKMAVKKDDEQIDTAKHPIVRFCSKHFRATTSCDGHNFFTKIDGKRFMTPLFIVLLVIEFSDIIFAVDSIPAVFSVTTDSMIVFTSNIFAIMGLRSLFFLMDGIADKFWCLKYGLGLLLTFIGVKMIGHEFFQWEISTLVSLLVILGVLVGSIALSLLIPKRERASR